MKEKTLKLLEVTDDEMGILNILKEKTKDVTIEPYIDYRDFEGIESLVVKCKSREAFEDEVNECYNEAINYEYDFLFDELVKDVKSVYTGYDDLSDDLYEYIREYVYEQVPVSFPISQFLNRTIRVNMFITFRNSTDAETDELDITTISKILENLGYVHTKTLLKEVRKGEYDKEDKFLDSLHTEIINSYPTQYNYFCVVGEITIAEYYKIKQNPIGTRIHIKHQNYCGFVDPYNGGGSTLSIDIPTEKVLTCRGANVIKLLVEKSGQQYTVDQIYGLTSNCYQPIEVK